MKRFRTAELATPRLTSADSLTRLAPPRIRPGLVSRPAGVGAPTAGLALTPAPATPLLPSQMEPWQWELLRDLTLEMLALEECVPWARVRRHWRTRRTSWRRALKLTETTADLVARLKVGKGEWCKVQGAGLLYWLRALGRGAVAPVDGSRVGRSAMSGEAQQLPSSAPLHETSCCSFLLSTIGAEGGSAGRRQRAAGLRGRVGRLALQLLTQRGGSGARRDCLGRAAGRRRRLARGAGRPGRAGPAGVWGAAADPGRGRALRRASARGGPPPRPQIGRAHV